MLAIAVRGRLVIGLALAVVASNVFVMRHPLLDGEVDRFTLLEGS